MAFKFENLQVWQKAIQFSVTIHELTKSFPIEERFNLSSQISRAADSISLNIAEGSTGQSNREFQRFLGYANRSAIEVVGCLHLLRAKAMIDAETFDKLYSDLTEIIRMTQGLRNSLTKPNNT